MASTEDQTSSAANRLANLPVHLASLVWDRLDGDERSRSHLMQVSGQLQSLLAPSITSLKILLLQQPASGKGFLRGLCRAVQVRKLTLVGGATDREQQKQLCCSLATVSGSPQFSRVVTLNLKVMRGYD
jgi:hypothetical protein